MVEGPVIDVHGMTRDEAKQFISLNLHHFHNRGYNEVYIIHGNGSGVLKTMVRKYLKQCGYVKSIRIQNNDGVSVAMFE